MNLSVKQERFLFAFFVFFSVLLLRLPWINCDAGISSFWDFGYFVTDEGYYTGDGRLAYLTGDFFSPRGESMSFLTMPVTCVLSYLSYCVFGLKTWAPRVPQLLASLWLWMLVYHMGAKRTRPWLAGMLVVLVSSTPPFLAHERSICTDFLMGVFCVTSLWILSGKRGVAGGILGAFFFVLAVLTKTSAWGLFPLVFCFSLLHNKHRWKRSVAFCAGLGGLLFIYNFFVTGYVQQLANEAGVSVKYAMDMGYHVDSPPRITYEKIGGYLRAWSVFLRWPVMGRVSFFVPWMFALSGIVLFAKIMKSPVKRWSRSSVIALGSLVYCLLISIHVKCNVRYFLPVFSLLPIFLIEARRSVLAGQKTITYGRVLICPLMIAGAFLIFWKVPVGDVPLKDIVCSQYTFPKAVLWSLTYPMLLVYGVCGAVCGFVFAAEGMRIKFTVTGLLSALWMGQLIQSSSVFVRTNATLPVEMKSNYLMIQFLLIFISSFLFSMFFLFPGKLRSYRIWYGGILCSLLLTFFLNPYWSQSLKELAVRKYTSQKTKKELCKRVPQNSVIIGARAQSLFLETGCSLVPYLYMKDQRAENFWTEIAEQMKKDPARPFLVLLEPQEPHSWKDLSAQKDLLEYKVIGKFLLPSFADGSFKETYLAQLKLL